jgi:hypothetical protein
MNTLNFISPIKQKKDTRPIEEILKSTKKLFETQRAKDNNSPVSHGLTVSGHISQPSTQRAHLSSVKEINENLKILKKRTQTVLELYSELLIKSSNSNTQTISNFHFTNKRKNQSSCEDSIQEKSNN